MLLAGFSLLQPGYAQLQKGNLLGTFSGSLSYFHQKMVIEDDEDYAYITNNIGCALSEEIGFFITDRLVLGPGISLSFNNKRIKDMYGEDIQDEYNTLSVSGLFIPYLRYYFAGNDKMAGFIHVYGKIGYGFWAYKDIDDEEDEGTSNSIDFGGGAGIGFAYFITPSIGLETQLFYDFQGSAFTEKVENDEDEFKYNEYRSSFGVSVGLNFYLQPRHKKTKE